MGSILHGSARTTPRLRAELQASQESTRSLAGRYGPMTCGPEEIRLAARSAHEGGVPWVLDPVAVGAGAAEYDAVVKSLLEFNPTAIRGNASELIALAGGDGGGQGVETTVTSDQAVPFLEKVAAEIGTIAAVSGATDYITDGKTTYSVGGGDIRLTQVTGGRLLARCADRSDACPR